MAGQPIMEIFNIFNFEAVHRLPNVPGGHNDGQLHGSFITDSKMPGIDGVEAHHRVKAVSPESVVIMMAGFSI